ncbi:hypothetical protein GCM10027614_06730 [Micromonospora vulcania]
MLKSRAFDATDADTLDEIIELCGRLPLALAILAARLSARPHLSLLSVAAELRDGARRLAAFPGGRGISDPRTAFSWSYRQLSPGAARLFRLLSAGLSPGITVDACVSLSGQDPHRTRAELEELAEAALVAEGDNGCFTSHVLVKAYAEELFRATEPPAEQHAAVGRLLQHYLHSSLHAEVVLDGYRTPIALPPPLPGVVPERPASYPEALAWFAGQRDVLKEAVRVAADLGHGIVPWQLAITMQPYLEWFGLFQDWEDVMCLALRAARERGTWSARRTCCAAWLARGGSSTRTGKLSTCWGRPCASTPSTTCFRSRRWCTSTSTWCTARSGSTSWRSRAAPRPPT